MIIWLMKSGPRNVEAAPIRTPQTRDRGSSCHFCHCAWTPKCQKPALDDGFWLWNAHVL